MALSPRKYTDAIPNAMASAINSSRNGDPQVLVNYGVATLSSGVATVSSGLMGSLGSLLTADCLIWLSRSKVNNGTLAGHLSAPQTQITGPIGTFAGSFVISSSNASDSSAVYWQVMQPAIHQDVSSAQTGSFDNPSSVNVVSLVGTAVTTLASAIAVCQQLDAAYRTHLADSVAHVKTDTTNVPSPAIATVVDQTTLDTYLNALQTSYNAHLTQSGVHVVNDTVNSNSTTAATTLNTSIALVNALAASLLTHVGRAIPGSAVSLSNS